VNPRALGALALTIALGLGAWAWTRTRTHAIPPSQVATPRLVSLAPAVSETLKALGAGEQLVAVSDYCADARKLPRVGSAITPNYEAIARARPTRILATQVGGSQLAPLTRIAPTTELPWLSVAEASASVRRLGELTGQNSRGNALAARFAKVLDVEPPPSGPRVLVLIGDAGAGTSSYWFIKRDSLHGALLHAAGARNAVPDAVMGAPRISVEELLRLDPDAVVIFGADTRGPASVEPLLAELRKLEPLRAVKANRLGALVAPELLGSGPALLEFVEPLRTEIARLLARPTP